MFMILKTSVCQYLTSCLVIRNECKHMGLLRDEIQVQQ